MYVTKIKYFNAEIRFRNNGKSLRNLGRFCLAISFKFAM